MNENSEELMHKIELLKSEGTKRLLTIRSAIEKLKEQKRLLEDDNVEETNTK